MSTQGPLSPNTCADDAAVGTVAWTDPDNAKVSDDVYATSAVTSSATTHYLKATNFGFSIPSGAIVNGIQVDIERHRFGSSVSLNDSEVKIVKADGTIGTINKASATAWNDTLDTYYSYGSSSDLWDETWDSTKINDADFGVVLSIVSNDAFTKIGYVDHIRITVYYTPFSPFPSHFNI